MNSTPSEQLAKVRRQTQAEKLIAKAEQALRAAKLPPWEREYRFCPERRWKLDIAWPETRLSTIPSDPGPGVAIEVHGGIYSHGRHTRGSGFEADREKMNSAQLLGWTVIEVTEHHIDNGMMVDWVKRALQHGD